MIYIHLETSLLHIFPTEHTWNSFSTDVNLEFVFSRPPQQSLTEHLLCIRCCKDGGDDDDANESERRLSIYCVPSIVAEYFMCIRS